MVGEDVSSTCLVESQTVGKRGGQCNASPSAPIPTKAGWDSQDGAPRRPGAAHPHVDAEGVEALPDGHPAASDGLHPQGRGERARRRAPPPPPSGPSHPPPPSRGVTEFTKKPGVISF